MCSSGIVKCHNYARGFGIFSTMPKRSKVNPQARAQRARAKAIPSMQATAELKQNEQEAQGKTVEQWQELVRFLNFRVMELKEGQSQARPMLPETKKRILEAWLEFLKFLGFPALPSARDKLLEMLKTEGHSPEDLASAGMLTGMLVAFALLMDRHLEKSEEPTPEELEKKLAAFQEIRYKARGIVKESTAKLVKTMPHDPGGHPRSLTTEQRAEICHEIAQMIEQGFLKREAFI